MFEIGVPPKPQTHGWLSRIVVGFLHFFYVLFYLPCSIAHLLLGWSRLSWILLDLMVIPAALTRMVLSRLGPRARKRGLKINALSHVHLACRLCPKERQALRDPKGAGQCAWNLRWNRGEYEIAPDFGGTNWFRQFSGRTRLDGFQHLAASPASTPQKDNTKPWFQSLVLNLVLLGIWWMSNQEAFVLFSGG